METIQAIKAEKQKKHDANCDAFGMFFAFSDEQFNENKTALKEGDKYVSIGHGGFMPKSNVDAWLDGCKVINKWFKEATKEAKLRRDNIAYELDNHEAYYTGEIDDTLAVLGDDYTKEEVMNVLNHG